MIITEFSKETVKNHKNSKCLIIADYRNVNYENESNTLQSKLSDKYNIDLYPIIFFTPLVVRALIKYYGDYDIWIIDESIIDEVKDYKNLLSEIPISY